MQLILVAGGAPDASFLKNQIEAMTAEDLCLVGIDAGVKAIEDAGFRPDVIIGDFDSVSAEERSRILDRYPEQIALDPVKDDTDLEAAIRWSLRQKPKRVVLLGVLGKRMDHSLTNLRLLMLYREAGIEAVILDRWNRIRIIGGSVRLRREELYGPYISLIPVTVPVHGISLYGFKYPLEDAVLEPFSSLGVSNELTGEEGEIRFRDGFLYLMETKDR